MPRTRPAYPPEFSPDLIGRDFTADAPNLRWTADITYVPTHEGRLYLAVVLDLFSRKIVGWAMADHMRTELVTHALAMAIAARRPRPGLVHHSDKGSQGEFNWSSQHLLITEVCNGTTEEADAAGTTGCAAAVGCGQGDAAADALAGPA